MFSKPNINNSIYDNLANDWWNKDSFLNILETGMQPARSKYILSELSKTRLSKIAGLELDVVVEFFLSFSLQFALRQLVLMFRRQV